MKKLLSVLLLLCILITSLVACNQDGPSTETQSKTEDASTVDSTVAEPNDSADVTTTANADSSEPEDTTAEPDEEIPDHVITPAEGEVILSLYKTGELTGWLDNNSGNNLTIEERYGVQALTHAMAPTSISFKKKFSLDWTKYERENIYIVVDIYIDETPLIDDYRGSLKIKNGDRDDDTGNTSENNQLNFNVIDLKLQGGWNSYVLPLSEAIPDKGDDYTIADWFCLWINGLGVPYEVGIGRLEIVYNPAA